MADAAEDGQLVGLETHPRPAAEAEPSAGELALEVLGGHRQTGRQAFHHDDQRTPMGLAGGQEAQHPGKSNRGVAWGGPDDLLTTPTGRGRARGGHPRAPR